MFFVILGLAHQCNQLIKSQLPSLLQPFHCKILAIDSTVVDFWNLLSNHKHNAITLLKQKAGFNKNCTRFVGSQVGAKDFHL